MRRLPSLSPWASFISLMYLKLGRSIRVCAILALCSLTHTLSLAEDKALSIPAVVAKVRPSVVTILTRGTTAGSSPHAPQSGSGSGIIIDASGYILTNNHLVEGVKSLVVGLSSGRLTP